MALGKSRLRPPQIKDLTGPEKTPTYTSELRQAHMSKGESVDTLQPRITALEDLPYVSDLGSSSGSSSVSKEYYLLTSDE